MFDIKNNSKLVLASKARNKFFCVHDTKHAKGKVMQDLSLNFFFFKGYLKNSVLIHKLVETWCCVFTNGDSSSKQYTRVFPYGTTNFPGQKIPEHRYFKNDAIWNKAEISIIIPI